MRDDQPGAMDQAARLEATFHPHPITGPEISGWFEDALDRDEKKPSLTDCEHLAHFIANYFPLGWYDRNPAETVRKVYKRHIAEAASKLFMNIETLAGYYSTQEWETQNRRYAYATILDLLPMIGGGPLLPIPESKPGHPGLDASPIKTHYLGGKPRPLDWRPAGHAFADAISASLKLAGYTGTLSKTVPESPTILIATKAINRTFGLGLSNEGVVTGLKPQRDRSKQSSKLL